MGALPDHAPPLGVTRRPEDAPPLAVVPGSRRATEPEPNPEPEPEATAPPEAAPRPSPPGAQPEPVSAPPEQDPDNEGTTAESEKPGRWKTVLLPPDLLHTAPPSIAELLAHAQQERALPSTAMRWLYLPHVGLACLATLLAVLLAEAVRNPARFWAYTAAVGLLTMVGFHLD